MLFSMGSIGKVLIFKDLRVGETTGERRTIRKINKCINTFMMDAFGKNLPEKYLLIVKRIRII